MAKKRQPDTHKPANQPAKSVSSSHKINPAVWSRSIPWITAGVFALLAWTILAVMSPDFLYTLQERSLFIADDTFWQQCMATPAGWTRWAGCYLTQFFYYPACGAALLVALWTATYALLFKTLRIQRAWAALASVPLFGMLCGTIGIGYWIYSHKLPGFPFSESIALLFVALAWWVSSRLTTPWKRCLWLSVWTIAGYPLFGWWALLGTLCMALHTWVTNRSQALYPTLTAAALIGIVPLLWYYHYTQVRLEDMWQAGFPLFQIGKDISLTTSLPFILTAVALAALAVMPLHKPAKWAWAVSAATLVGCSAAAWMTQFDNYNYQAEMRMYRQTENCEWKKVIEEANQWPGIPTRQMVIMKNIALMNIRQLGNAAFRFDNRGELPHTRDSLKVHLTLTGAPMIYVNYGKFNYATRWSIENSVEYGWQVAYLKILARCAIVNGEQALADKYITLLGKTTFHRDYADELQAINLELKKTGDRAKAAEALGLKNAYELNNHLTNDLDSDNGLCEMYLLHHFSNTMNIDSKLLQEVTLNYAMISKSIQLFWPRFFQYATLHAGEDIPIHYQEAAYLYGTLEPQTVSIKNMPFDKLRIIERYKRFDQTVSGYINRGMTTQQAGEACRAQFGNTFWWFYFFCNDVKSY